MTFSSFVVLAKIGAAHGIKGQFRLLFYGENPDNLTELGPLTDQATGKTCTLTHIKPLKGQLYLAKIKGVDTREAIEALKDHELAIERSALPPPEDEETYYHADLIGLSVQDDQGKQIGKVRAVHNFGANDLLDIQPDKGASFMVPFTLKDVPECYPCEGYCVIHNSYLSDLDDTMPNESGDTETHP
jgi:16S rRNA processing protein RimM